MPLSQGQAYLLRREKEDGIGKAEGAGFTRQDEQWQYGGGKVPERAFFPRGPSPGGKGGWGGHGRR
jgi:hypothetical protein